MCPDIFRDVTECDAVGIPGVLHGYRRHVVRGEVYPALAPCAGVMVKGIVYSDLPESAWSRLDRFEGDGYDHVTVTVETSDQGRTTAYAYVAKPEFIPQLEDADWDFDAFVRHGKAAFEAHYMGYRTLQAN